MDTQRLLDILGYANSDHFVRPERFENYPGYSYLFRQAKKDCGLEGVYALTEPREDTASLTPVVYVCEAQDRERAAEIHKKVWNQNTVPFLLVSTPTEFRLYRGFQYRAGGEDRRDQAIKVVEDANKVIEEFQDLKADSIDSGKIWQTRAFEGAWGGVT